jgi:hypothetical protein
LSSTYVAWLSSEFLTGAKQELQDFSNIELHQMDFADLRLLAGKGIGKGYAKRRLHPFYFFQHHPFPDDGAGAKRTGVDAIAKSTELFRVTREEIGTFPGNWEPLRGKSVKLYSVQPASHCRKKLWPGTNVILRKNFSCERCKNNPLRRRPSLASW